MTVQFSEILNWNEKQYCMDPYPLEDYFEQGAFRPNFGLPSTALRRGYQGTWEIMGDYLYLTGLDGVLEDGTAVTEAAIFSGAIGPVLAEWFSGLLILPTGELLSSGYMGHNPVYAETTLITIEHGHVVRFEVRPHEQPLPTPVIPSKLTVAGKRCIVGPL